MKPFCPHCGYDLHLDAPILLNDFAMLGPISPVLYQGQAITDLTAYERSVCWTLMKAYPDPVRIDIILDRIGSDGSSNTVQVYICRLRKKFKAAGAPNVFKPTRHRGDRAYCWVP